MRYVLLNKEKIVTHIIVWNGAEYMPPRNAVYVIPSEVAEEGDVWDEDNHIFISKVKTTRNWDSIKNEPKRDAPLISK